MHSARSTEYEKACFGMGCFWCAEAIFRTVPGLQAFQVGYMGGSSPNPDYRSVCSGTTGHAEVLHFEYSGGAARYAQLVQLFLQGHDPTSLNRQGADCGTQYRSVIFYDSAEQEQTAMVTLQAAQEKYAQKIVTEISAASQFYPAELAHQNYFEHNRSAPYCQSVIQPKLDQIAGYGP